MPAGNRKVGSKYISLVIVLIASLAPPEFLYGGQREPPEFPGFELLMSQESFRFAEQLRVEKSYADAITEYRRFIFFNSGSPLARQALFNIGDSYFRAGMFEDALEVFSGVSLFGPDDLRFRSRIMMARCHMAEGDFISAELELDSAGKIARIEDEPAHLPYWRGWVSLKRHDWDGAELNFMKASPLFRDPVAAGKARDLALAAASGGELPLKSEALAFWLSTFVPGLGQIYSGNIGIGITSFITNLVLGYYSIRSFSEGRKIEGFSFLFLLWQRYYIGNRYRAVQYAKAYNDSLRSSYLSRIEREFPEEVNIDQ